MRVLLGCEPNGFGPASKLTAIARLLDGCERVFVGDAGAFDFARLNGECYERFLTLDAFRAAPELAASCDFAVVVMEPDLAFDLLAAGVPVFLFDSLIEFWALPDGVAPLARAARTILARPFEEGRALFESFSVHERKLLAHLIATRSFAQNFPGVPERLEELAAHGFRGVRLLGSIIDAPGPAVATPPVGEAADGSWSMLVSLGGVQNFAIAFDDNDHAVGLIERWAERFLADTADCREITICCGKYGAPDARSVQGRRLVRRCVAHEEFMRLLARADVVLAAAGRTTLHEALHLGKLPILLPEQHHNQFCNIKSLARTRLGRMAVALDDVTPLDAMPEDDFAGTAFIVEQTRRILQSDALFARFDHLLRRRIEAFRRMDDAERQAVVDEAAGTMTGADFDCAVRDMVALVARWRAGRFPKAVGRG